MRQFTPMIMTAIALFVLLLTGCGQKGDLYQPKASIAESDVSTHHPG